jgi:hypothetical protein
MLHGEGEDPAIVRNWYSVHRSDEGKALARDLGFRLVFVSPGVTDECWPLDRSVFGPMQRKSGGQEGRLQRKRGCGGRGAAEEERLGRGEAGEGGEEEPQFRECKSGAPCGQARCLIGPVGQAVGHRGEDSCVSDFKISSAGA